MKDGPQDNRKPAPLNDDSDTWLGVLDKMPVAVVVAEVPSGRFLWYNSKAEEVLGHPVIPMASAGDYARYQGVHEDGTPYQAHEYPLARAVHDGEVIEHELLYYRRGDGQLAILEFNASRVTCPNGELVAVAAYQDVTKGHLAQLALKEAAERVQLALDAGAIVGTWVWDPKADLFTADERFAQSFGLDPESCRTGLEKEAAFASVHPEDRAGLAAAIDEALASGGAYRHQYRIRQQHGGDLWVEASGRVEMDASGTPARFAGVLVDITASKQAEEARSLLMREVDHRARNALAMVQSVVRLTDGSDPARYREEVIGRVDAMARAQGSLSRSNWEGGVLEDLIHEELSSCAPTQQFTISGPKITLPAGHVQPLNMIVHELATNAMKYGALSVPGGRVNVASEAHGRRDFVLTWKESGGPAVEPPARSGFGSRLINGLADQLAGSIEMDWQASGLVATLRWRCQAALTPGKH